MCADSSLARYHATPPSSRASVMRSTVESKNAPRWLAESDALAKAPSSRSGRAARIDEQQAEQEVPAADGERRADAEHEAGDRQVVGRQLGAAQQDAESA